jgi:uncharacterized protein
MVKKIIVYYFLLISILIINRNTSIYAATSFSPWNADVRIADDNIPFKIHKKEPYPNIFSSPGACGYILIRFYQIVISPQDGPNCRFHPTCSQYGRLAVERFGLILGGVMAGDRLIRCNPYNPPGDDPLPRNISGK